MYMRESKVPHRARLFYGILLEEALIQKVRGDIIFFKPQKYSSILRTIWNLPPYPVFSRRRGANFRIRLEPFYISVNQNLFTTAQFCINYLCHGWTFRKVRKCFVKAASIVSWIVYIIVSEVIERKISNQTTYTI